MLSLTLCTEDVLLLEFMYLVFTHMSGGESYRRRLRPLLLCLCVLINFPVCSFCLFVCCVQKNSDNYIKVLGTNTIDFYFKIYLNG